MENKERTPRTKLREQAFCLIYEYSFNKDAENLEELFDTAVRLYGYGDDTYLKTVFYGVVNEADKIDEVISKYAVGWKLERISRVSLSIMRLCLYECRYLEDVPPAVAMNEAKTNYEEKHDKATFIKNIISDNILPGDVYDRAKELHISARSSHMNPIIASP